MTTINESTIGIDAIPTGLLNSKYLSNTHIKLLASVAAIPIVDNTFTDDTLKNIIQYYAVNPDEMETELHRYASILLNENKVNEAWQVLLVGENM